MDGGDIDQPQEITNPMSVKISVTAPGAIAGFTVTIDSPALTAEMLAKVGLATELNLVNPGSMAEALGALGCRYYQGYLFSPAIPLSELKKYIREH